MSRVVKRSASQAVKPGRSRRDVPLPQFVPPQLSQPVEKPPSGPQWVHEIKLDGYRMAARIDNGRVQLLTRTGLDWTAKYPSVVAALANLNVKTAYIDGELCGVDEAGLPSFAKHRRRQTASAECISSITLSISCISAAGTSLALPLIERKALLEPLVANKPGLQFNGHDTGDGELILKHAGKLGFEGVVSKTIDAPYAPGNRGLWRKAKALNRQEFVIVGWSDRKDRGLISGRCCSATTRTVASSSMQAAWGRGCPIKFSPTCGAASILSPARHRAPKRPTASQDPVRLTARPVARSLGRAEACRGDHVSDLDGRQPIAATVYVGLREDKPATEVRREAARSITPNANL